MITDFDLQKHIFEAVREGRSVLELPRGQYILKRPLLIDRAKDLTIEGNGSVLIYAIAADPELPMTFATMIHNCSNVTLRNLTIDFDPLPFTQGTLVNMATDGTWYDVRIHQGYRSDVEFFAFDINRGELSLHLFDSKTQLLKVGSSFLFPNRVTSPQEGILRFWFEKNPDPVNHYYMEIGDYIATAAWRAVAFAIRDSEGTKLENVTIWASGGAAISDIGGEGGTDLQITLTPGPRPKGASQDRLWSASRDGYHACCMRRGTIIHDSQFVSLGDDAINILSPIYQVASKDLNQVKLVDMQDGSSPSLQPGDELFIYDSGQLVEKARTRVIAIGSGGKITLETGAGVEKNDLVFCPDIGGRGTIVRNSLFRNIDGSAIAVKSHDAIIENNTVEHVALVGIELSVYLNHYYEGPFANNTIVRNNTVRDIGFSGLVLDGDWLLNGGIAIGVADIKTSSMLKGNRGFREILVEGNTIDGTTGVGLFISNASDVTVKNNHLFNTNKHSSSTGRNWWNIPINSAIYVIESDRVVFENNTVSQIGEYGSKELEIHPSCSDIDIKR